MIPHVVGRAPAGVPGGRTALVGEHRQGDRPSRLSAPAVRAAARRGSGVEQVPRGDAVDEG
ncbi:hypothetical protein K7G98_25750, partial [Saccharothrix sp. MB29]|nr:hypothetical protein [Saccharothrix sp. MB29]